LLTQISDKRQLLSFLKTDPFLHVYSIGDLDDFFWERTTWYAWVEQNAIRALFLLYQGDDSVPTLLALEEQNSEVAIALLHDLRHSLPERFYGQNQRDIHLRQGDLQRVLTLYREAYPGNWFDPRMLETGQYLGIEDAGRLVAVAGIHVFSPQYKVVALGNITTHPAFRGKGLSTLLTSSLCRQLFETVDWIGLNVAYGNHAAIRCYSKIGFVEHCRFEEILVTGRI